MTVGEKIQFYRKKSGLSQEELGQRLLVSRQTVSLWEMDKTLPTVDNLLRLKEIFSVSMDDFFDESDPCIGPQESPREVYRFQYSCLDLQAYWKHTSRPFIKRIVAVLFACVVLFVFLGITNAPDILSGLVLGFYLSLIIFHIRGYYQYKKSWKSSEIRLLEGVYTYELYDQHFVLTIVRNEEIVKTAKISYREIEKIQIFGEYMVLEIAGQGYIIKKEALNADSAFYFLYRQRHIKVEEKFPGKRLKQLSDLLFVASIVSIFGALIGTGILSEFYHTFAENLWIFFLFTAIPIASIILGFYLKKKGFTHRKNIIVGIIMTVILCLYGSFYFNFNGMYSHGDEPILRVEEMLSVDIPEHSRINTEDWSKGTQTGSGSYTYYISDIYFNKDAVKEFEESLLKDKKWMAVVPSNMIGILSPHGNLSRYDYCIIYNISTGEINKLPSQNGTYRFLNVLYDSDKNVMKLVEYEIDYVE